MVLSSLNNISLPGSGPPFPPNAGSSLIISPSSSLLPNQRLHSNKYRSLVAGLSMVIWKDNQKLTAPHTS